MSAQKTWEAWQGSLAPELGRRPADAEDSKSGEILAIDEALDTLGKIDPRKAKVVELRFFGGLSVEETAEVLAISPQSVMRGWRMTRAWLLAELARG